MEKEIAATIFKDNYILLYSYYQLINGTPGFSCTGAFDNATDPIFKIKRSKPDVVLMDIDMPKIPGIEAAGIIKQNFPSIHIVMETVFEDEEKIFLAIQAGAEGYILKKQRLQNAGSYCRSKKWRSSNDAKRRIKDTETISLISKTFTE